MKLLLVLMTLFLVAGAGSLLDNNYVFYSAPVVALLMSLALFVKEQSRRD